MLVQKYLKNKSIKYFKTAKLQMLMDYYSKCLKPNNINR